ncbi:tripartite motif-containing protein 75-like [Palaemon carinicauda]|uniref:tripartite motif-containing protein 75-like n=1 Tax=Palaemon carinicauda TaxID=392227 RepID=UPI0035B60D71
MNPLFSCEFCGGCMGDEDKKPLVLPCGHTFCTPCVCEFFKGSNCKCPTCICQHHSRNVNSIPVNYTLLEIIKAESYSRDEKDTDLKTLPALCKDIPNHSNIEKKSPKILPEYKIENAQSFKELLLPAGRCENHDMHCTFWCKSCKEWICDDCIVIDHPSSQCEIRTIGEALGELKLEGDLCLKKTIKLFDNHFEKYCVKQLALRGMRENSGALIKDLQRLLSKLKKAKIDIERQTETIKSCLTDGLSNLLTLLESQRQLLEAQTLEKVLLARHRAKICQSRILDWHNPNITLLSEEMSYSEVLQKSTFTALAVLRDCLSSDNSPIK